MVVRETYGTLRCLHQSWSRASHCVLLQFMHNGGIAEFPKIKRALQTAVPDDLFNMVTGNTGPLPLRTRVHYFLIRPQIRSGHLLSSFQRFVMHLLCLSLEAARLTAMQLPDPQARSFTPAVLQKAMLETIAHINRLLDEHDVTEVRTPHITYERLTYIPQA